MNARTTLSRMEKLPDGKGCKTFRENNKKREESREGGMPKRLH